MTFLSRFTATCCIVFLSLTLVVPVSTFAADDTINLDAASGTAQTSQVQEVPGDTLYTFVVPGQIILGVAKLGASSKLAFTSGGQSSAVVTDNKWIITDLRGNLLDTTHLQIGNTAGQGFGFRDLAWDGSRLLTSDNAALRFVDTATYTESRAQVTGPGTLQRGLAADGPNRIWKSNFTTDPVAMFDSTGVIRKTLGIPPVAPYGIGLDKWTTPGKAWLWYSEPSATGQPVRLSKIDTSTGAIVTTYNYGVVAGTAISGGLDIVNNHPDYPGRVVAFLVGQRFPTSPVLVLDLGPDSTATSGGADTLLVLLHDSTTVTSLAKRKADRDTLFKYLGSIAPVYKTVYLDTAGAALPSLTNYKSILYQETSFDAITCRFLGASSRTAIKNWLNSGTPANKKRFVMVGADLGYNYSQSAQPCTDTAFAHGMMKFVYGVDNGNTALSITGVGINPGGVLTYSTTVPGGGFYPDGNTYRSGGAVLYKYTNRATADSVAAVGYAATGYTAASLFMDPRYFTGNGPTSGFPKALRDMLQFAGIVTDVKIPTPGELPNDFVLTQNYPNPFNPTTTIQFGLPMAANVTVKIYNVLGQEVATLVEGMRSAGTFETVWDGRNAAGTNVASGMYFYSLVAKSADGKATFSNIKKMLLVK